LHGEGTVHQGVKAGKWLRRPKKANYISNARHVDGSSHLAKLRGNTNALSPQG
jgi:hypothetical protein